MGEKDRNIWMAIVKLIIQNLPEIIDLIDGDDDLPLIKAP